MHRVILKSVLVPSASRCKGLSRHDQIIQLSRCLVNTMEDRVSKLSDILEELVRRLRIRKIWSRRLEQGSRLLPPTQSPRPPQRNSMTWTVWLKGSAGD